MDAAVRPAGPAPTTTTGSAVPRRDVAVDGMPAQIQALGDLCVVQPVRNEAEDLSLANAGILTRGSLPLTPRAEQRESLAGNSCLGFSAFEPTQRFERRREEHPRLGRLIGSRAHTEQIDGVLCGLPGAIVIPGRRQGAGTRQTAASAHVRRPQLLRLAFDLRGDRLGLVGVSGGGTGPRQKLEGGQVVGECRTVSKRIIGSGPGDEAAFIEAFKIARNYYTHYNPSLEKKAARGAALYVLFIQLQAIIEMSLLRELGFGCRSIEAILDRVQRYAEIKHFKALVADEEGDGA
jgi:hypothetical protein